MEFDTGIDDFRIRPAVKKDTALILQFIKALAEYEHMLELVVTTEEDLRSYLFTEKKAEVIIGEYLGEPVCYALFFHNFSTFSGRSGIFLEDIYVKPEMRGKGFGTSIFYYLGKLAKESSCSRLEWWVLNWNEPSIRFYQSLGAKPLSDWTIYRLEGDALGSLANHTEAAG